MERRVRPEDVKITQFAATRVAVLEHRGAPALIEDSVRRFIAWRKEVGLPPWLSATFNILYDDPGTTRPEQFRLGLCAATEREIAANAAGIVAMTIPGGRCAVLRHVGSNDALGRAATYLRAEWLPGSGEQPRDFPLYVQRLTLLPEVPEHEAVADIFLPLR